MFYLPPDIELACLCIGERERGHALCKKCEELIASGLFDEKL